MTSAEGRANPVKYAGHTTIQWLVQSAADLPEPDADLIAGGMLSAEEVVAFKGLKISKRRNDWLLGRWTAKRLLQEISSTNSGEWPPLESISITSLSNGAPSVSCSLPYVTLSISHSNGMAFCAAVARQNWPLGADIERIEPRPEGFAADYFTEVEIDLINGAAVKEGGNNRDLQVTAIWSAKEAALKALNLGLTVDTRAVSCLIGPLTGAPKEWAPFQIVVDDKLNFVQPLKLVQPLSSAHTEPVEIPRLLGWWRVLDEFVLCLAVGEYTQLSSGLAKRVSELSKAQG